MFTPAICNFGKIVQIPFGRMAMPEKLLNIYQEDGRRKANGIINIEIKFRKASLF